MIDSCKHEHWEMEAASADGVCPICVASELEELRKDRERLDWLAQYHENKIESSVVHRHFSRNFRGGTCAWTLREAIDAAMKAEEGE